LLHTLQATQEEHWILKRGPASDLPALAYSKGRQDRWFG